MAPPVKREKKKSLANWSLKNICPLKFDCRGIIACTSYIKSTTAPKCTLKCKKNSTLPAEILCSLLLIPCSPFHPVSLSTLFSLWNWSPHLSLACCHVLTWWPMHLFDHLASQDQARRQAHYYYFPLRPFFISDFLPPFFYQKKDIQAQRLQGQTSWVSVDTQLRTKVDRILMYMYIYPWQLAIAPPSPFPTTDSLQLWHKHNLSLAFFFSISPSNAHASHVAKY